MSLPYPARGIDKALFVLVGLTLAPSFAQHFAKRLGLPKWICEALFLESLFLESCCALGYIS
jgi:hypothetical protein